MMRISLTYFKFLISVLLFPVFIGNLSFAQNDHISCILIAEDKDYITYVEFPLYFRSTPRENLIRTVTINVTYNGFSAEAQTDFQYAVDIIETEITSAVTI
ncbi:MAG: hypothetical protein OEM46_02600 [Ignavibacteria bacterium]|nr:hypothetical protein [Ignavibacteria bacterium]